MANQFGKWGGTVDTLANLSAIATTPLEDGQFRPCMENESIYVLHKGSASAVSGENVVAADVAGNKWHRYGSGNQVGFGTADPPTPNDAGYLFYIKDLTGSQYQFHSWNGTAWVLTYDTSSTPDITLNVATGTAAPPTPNTDLDVYYQSIAGPPARTLTWVWDGAAWGAIASSPIVYDFGSSTPGAVMATGDFIGQEVVNLFDRTVHKWFNDGLTTAWFPMYTFA